MYTNKMLKGLGICFLAALALIVVACTSPSSSSSSGTTDTTGGGTPDGGGGTTNCTNTTTSNYPSINFDETASPKYGLSPFDGATTSVVTSCDAGVPTDSGENAASGSLIKVVNGLTYQKDGVTKPAEMWSGANILKDGVETGLKTFFTFDVKTTAKKTVTARIWAPAADIPVTMKVEPSGQAAVEATVLTSTAGWQTVTWDFGAKKTGNPPVKTYETGSAEGGWAFKAWWTHLNTTPPTTTNISNPKPIHPATKAAMFFDYQQPKTTAKNFYIDNVRFGDETSTSVADFEDATKLGLATFFGGATTSVINATDDSLPADTGTNAAAGKIFKIANGAGAAIEKWAGADFTYNGTNTDSGIATFFAFAATGNYKISARVYAPAADLPIGMKLEPTGQSPVEAVVLTTAAGWQTLVWDFSAPLTGNPSGDPISNVGWDFKAWLTSQNATTSIDTNNPVAAADKAAIFFDYQQPKTVEKTFYIDNIHFEGDIDTTPVTPAKAITLIDFDSTDTASFGFGGFNGAVSTATTVSAESVSDTGTNAASGNIFKIVISGPGDVAEGFNLLKDKTNDSVITGMDSIFAFNTSGNTNKKVSARIYAPAADIPVTIELGYAPIIQATVLTTAQGWQTLTWDFGGIKTESPSADLLPGESAGGKTYLTGSAAGGWAFKAWSQLKDTATHSQTLTANLPTTGAPPHVAMFFDFQQPRTTDKTFYIDNIRFGAAP